LPLSAKIRQQLKGRAVVDPRIEANLVEEKDIRLLGTANGVSKLQLPSEHGRNIRLVEPSHLR